MAFRSVFTCAVVVAAAHAGQSEECLVGEVCAPTKGNAFIQVGRKLQQASKAASDDYLADTITPDDEDLEDAAMGEVTSEPETLEASLLDDDGSSRRRRHGSSSSSRRRSSSDSSASCRRRRHCDDTASHDDTGGAPAPSAASGPAPVPIPPGPCAAGSITNALNGKLRVHRLCLPEHISGFERNKTVKTRGPNTMHAVTHRNESGTMYFSWTADKAWGKSKDDGRIYVSKVSNVGTEGEPKLEESVAFDGFAKAGGIDITEDGIVGTLCAKYFPPWVKTFLREEPKNKSLNYGQKMHVEQAPMALAVCEVDSTTMKAHGIPWKIGRQYQNPELESHCRKTATWWGGYPNNLIQKSAGNGWLTYAPMSKRWSAWYGANVGIHMGSAMHTYDRDAAKLTDADADGCYKQWKDKLPEDEIESRQEVFDGPVDSARLGTGDHMAGAIWSYHSGLGDIGLLKSHARSKGGSEHAEVIMQQFGLAEGKGAFSPTGQTFSFKEVQKSSKGVPGAVKLVKNGDDAVQEGAIKRCGDGWILALMTAKGGNVCATVDDEGSIGAWESIEKSVGLMPCREDGHPCSDLIGGRMGRVAPLGMREATSCGSDARFLFGYEKADYSRWLVEVDGNCKAKESTRQEVTNFTTWPLYQDWATTAGGAVVWVTSWITDPPSSLIYYASKSEGKDGNLLGLTPGATEAAQLSVYYP